MRDSNRSNFRVLSAILRGFWFIEPDHALSLGPVVFDVLSGKNAKAFDDDDDEKATFDPDADLKFAHMSAGNVNYYPTLNDAPDGSVAIIPVMGELMKADFCGVPGMATRATQFKAAGAAKNIAAIIKHTDTPGGTVDGTQNFGNTIKQVDSIKPVVSLVDGMMCSGGMWLGSSTRLRISGNQTDIIGSIGTMLSFSDYRPVWEKMGIKFHDIFADKSSDKNRNVIEAREGKYGRIKDNLLNPMNEVFLQTIQKNLAGRINEKRENVLSGKTYLSDQALFAGLVDEQGDMDYAISRALELAEEAKGPKSHAVNPSPANNDASISNSNKMFGTNKFPKLAAIAGKTNGDITQEVLNAVNEELQANGITAVLVADSLAFASQGDTLKKLKTQLETVVKALDPEFTGDTTALVAFDAKGKVEGIQKELIDAQAEVVKLGGENGADPTKPLKTKDKVDEDEADPQSEIDNLPHNRALDNNPLFMYSKKSIDK